ncbi:hypothetical protein M0765_015340 [Variovorax sp. S2]|uniref:hypothetical protein n=1 Tax=Variovorax sp. S12S4 TaxID=3029170 RepID=UPI00215CFA86|nr:hypothetical protein [Variovorax sp. S12S4]MCR8959049.1 hypothetical protein [Variovorax sp. S12S4]
MTNFRSEELTAPSSEEMHSEFSDTAWERVNHPAMLRIAKRAVDIAASLFFLPLSAGFTSCLPLAFF